MNNGSMTVDATNQKWRRVYRLIKLLLTKSYFSVSSHLSSSIAAIHPEPAAVIACLK